MTRGLSFSEAFWDPDITGISGWEVLLKRMKDGKSVSNDISHFLKDRAKAEADYCKTLSNLAKKAGGKEETGRLGESWRMLKIQTEKMAAVHEEVSANFLQLADELNRFIDEQKQIVKQWDENMKKQIQTKKSEHQKTMSLKKSYENKCVELNTAQENLRTAMNAVTVKRTDQEKALVKKEKCDDAMKNADAAYKAGIDNLEAVRRNWESEMKQCCQVLEFKRIDFLRNKMWQCTNLDSIACVKHDEHAESVRVVLEKCDINTDLQEFVDKNQTGSKRPEQILYENYYKTCPIPVRPPAINTLSRQGTQRPAQALPTGHTIDADEGAYATVDPHFGKTSM